MQQEAQDNPKERYTHIINTYFQPHHRKMILDSRPWEPKEDPKDMPPAVPVQITKQFAVDLIDYKAANRNFKPTNISTLRKATNEGNIIYAEPFILDVNAIMIDAFHRAAVIRDSGTPQWYPVQTGVDPLAKAVIDIGVKRSYVDMLTMWRKEADLDPTNASFVAQVASGYFQISEYEKGDRISYGRNYQLPRGFLFSWLDNWDLSIARARKFCKLAKGITDPVGWFGGLWFKLAEASKDLDDVDKFMAYLIFKGTTNRQIEALDDEQRGLYDLSCTVDYGNVDPFVGKSGLTKRLTEISSSGQKGQDGWRKVALTIKAWNNIRTGSTTRLSFGDGNKKKKKTARWPLIEP